jgi:hypothetical protein
MYKRRSWRIRIRSVLAGFPPVGVKTGVFLDRTLHRLGLLDSDIFHATILFQRTVLFKMLKYRAWALNLDFVGKPTICWTHIHVGGQKKDRQVIAYDCLWLPASTLAYTTHTKQETNYGTHLDSWRHQFLITNRTHDTLRLTLKHT